VESVTPGFPLTQSQGDAGRLAAFRICKKSANRVDGIARIAVACRDSSPGEIV